MFMQYIEFDDAPQDKDMVIGMKLGKKAVEVLVHRVQHSLV